MQTLDELKSIKKKWYDDAASSGILGRIAKVCRELGLNLNSRYGPKYEYINGNIRVFVDDYGNYMDVHAEGKNVCSTHPCSRLFVPGDWTATIEAAYPAAVEVAAGKRLDREERERKALARDLGIE